MNAEIIAVGSELLTPQRLDTNSLFLTQQLNDLGVEVTTKYVVGDNRDHVADTVRRAMSRAEIVILSGGLGPTEDDVTRDAVSIATDRKLVFHAEIADQLEQRFRQANRKMAEVNRRQAFIIEGADILPNDRGTAPGQWIDDSQTSIILLPGPPHELKAMFSRQCLPRLERVVPRQVIRTLLFRITGMAESDLDQTIAPVYTKYANPVTTILAGDGDLQVHLRAHGSNESDVMALLTEVAGPIETLLGDRIYSRNGDSLEAVIGTALKKRQATLVVAESVTGGHLAQRITSVPGSSQYFLGGFLTYSNRLKTDLLGVSEEILQTHGAVSQEAAEAMAVGARRRTGATFAISVTGEAGPEPAENVPVGTVYIGLADASGCQVAHRVFFGDRPRIRVFATQMALDLLRRKCTLVL